MTLAPIGDRERFALAFELRPDPDPGGDPAKRASWGAFQIWVAGRNLTSGVLGTGDLVDAAECPLLPIVEWLIENWDPLLHEERLPFPISASSSARWYAACLPVALRSRLKTDQFLEVREDWWARHGLGSALPDFRLPDLHFRRSTDDIELSWDDREWRSVPRGVALTEPAGSARIGVREVVEVLHTWCRSLLGELSASQDASERAQALEVQLNSLGSSERQTKRLCWTSGDMVRQAALRIQQLAGSANVDLESIIRRLLGVTTAPTGGLYAVLPAPVLLFRSASPDMSENDIQTLLSLCEQEPVEEQSPLEEFRTPTRCNPIPAETTQQGYDLALEFRDALSLSENHPLTDEKDIEKHLLPRLGVSLQDLSLGDSGVDGVAVWVPHSRPLIAVNRHGRFAQKSSGRRMTIAHELCHLLFDGSESGVGLVSNPWAPYLPERRANAFAAMLLAPEAAISEVISQDFASWTMGEFVQAMRHLGVGLTMFTWHLHNLGWITESERQAIVEELTDTG